MRTLYKTKVLEVVHPLMQQRHLALPPPPKQSMTLMAPIKELGKRDRVEDYESSSEVLPPEVYSRLTIAEDREKELTTLLTRAE